MLKRLRLYGFRNLSEQWIDFSETTNVFVGSNGQGKSNILEAIYLLLTGESFRPAQISHFVQMGKTEASLRAQFFTDGQGENGEELNVVLKIQDQKKMVTVNDRKFTTRDWARLNPPILFSPESLNSIKGSAEERRKLIDELVMNINPQTPGILQDFRKALRMRNSLLRQHRDQEKPLRETQAVLEAINQKFLPLAVKVTELRLDALRKLAPEINSAMQKVSAGFPRIDLQYWISKEPAIHFSHQDIHNSLAKRMNDLALAEFSSGASLVGPQKHDIVFLFGGNDSRFFCSQGQQRSLILAFKIAQIMYHRKVLKRRPILLLDDVFSELDGEKRTNFIELMKTMDSQIVLTTTDYDLPQVFDTSATFTDGQVGTAKGGQVLVKQVLNGSLV